MRVTSPKCNKSYAIPLSLLPNNFFSDISRNQHKA